jgi:hypothetical protein
MDGLLHDLEQQSRSSVHASPAPQPGGSGLHLSPPSSRHVVPSQQASPNTSQVIPASRQFPAGTRSQTPPLSSTRGLSHRPGQHTSPNVQAPPASLQRGGGGGGGGSAKHLRQNPPQDPHVDPAQHLSPSTLQLSPAGRHGGGVGGWRGRQRRPAQPRLRIINTSPVA